MRFKVKATLACLSLLLALFGATVQAAQQYKGVTLRVAALSGSLSHAWHTHAQEWAKAHGARVEVIELPLTSMYERVMTDLITGGNQYDIIQYPSFWKGDIMGGGFAYPLDEFIKQDDPGWNDYLPVYRDRLSKWGDRIYGLQIDGDVWMFGYRNDLLSHPDEKKAFKAKYGYELGVPQTWQQFLDVAEFFNRKKGEKLAGKTLANDFYGSELILKRGGGMGSVWTFLTIFGSYLKTPHVYDGGIYFDPNTMEPLINTPAGVQALEVMKKAADRRRSGPGGLDVDWSTFGVDFSAGKTMMGIAWPDLGPFSLDPKRSNIIGDAGFAVVPGAEKVWNVAAKQWETVEKPHRAAPLAWGWTLVINAKARQPRAAYDLIKYMVTGERAKAYAISPDDGLDPFRKSLFSDQDVLKAYKTIPTFIPALQESLTVGVPDLMIPRAVAYYDALEIAIDEALRGKKSPQQALSEAAQRWKRITDEAGREKQRANYRFALGLPAK